MTDWKQIRKFDFGSKTYTNIKYITYYYQQGILQLILDTIGEEHIVYENVDDVIFDDAIGIDKVTMQRLNPPFVEFYLYEHQDLEFTRLLSNQRMIVVTFAQ